MLPSVLNPAVVIPAYNAARHLPDVLSRLAAVHPTDATIVVDDGSSDRTAEVAVKANAVVVIHQINRGKGEALKTGFDRALERGHDAIVMLDADGQHPPEFVPEMIAALEHCDLVLGARPFRFGEMPMERIVTNFVSSVAVSCAANARVRDSQTGYRAFRSDLLRRVRLDTGRFVMETEMLIKAGRAGFSIGHVSVPAVYADETSQQRLADQLRVIRLMWRSLFW
jgi:glycosyltransferase involved in cell wall biosynthesis